MYPAKRGSRDAAYAAMSLRWSVKFLARLRGNLTLHRVAVFMTRSAPTAYTYIYSFFSFYF